MNDEKRASSVSPEPSEVDDALADLIERFNEADSVREKEISSKKSKQAEDLVKAQELRKQSLETFGESRKRKEENAEPSSKRAKKGDTFSYLMEKSNREYELKTKELELRQKEIDIQAQRVQ